MPKKKKKEEEEIESETVDVETEDEEKKLKKTKDSTEKKEKAERTEKKEKAERTEKKEKAEKWEKILRKKIEVDFWRTDLHGKEIGIRQKDQQRAKSRQFSKDMDIYASVHIDDEDSGHVGFRTNEWERNRVTDGELKRLVIRYFTESDRWVASIEENTIKALMRSVGKEESLPIFNIFHKGNSKIFSLERIEKEWGQKDKAIVALLLEEDSKTVDFFMFVEKRWTLGQDWKVIRPHDKKRVLAEYDDKKFNIGGKVEIKIYDPELAENKIFVNTLILFGALMKFWKEVVSDLRNCYKEYRDGEIAFKPNRLEIDLLKNPRAVRR